MFGLTNVSIFLLGVEPKWSLAFALPLVSYPTRTLYCKYCKVLDLEFVSLLNLGPYKQRERCWRKITSFGFVLKKETADKNTSKYPKNIPSAVPR